MADTDFKRWHTAVLAAAEEKYGINGSELDAFAGHLMELQFDVEHLPPERAIEQLMQGYPAR